MVYVKRVYNKWTDAEIDMLRKRKVPPGRQLSASITKAAQLGFERPFPPSGIGSWTEEEIETLLSGKVPPGRSMSACRSKLYGRGLRMRPGKESGDITIEPVHRQRHH